jgi:hypothetical protein
MWPLFIGCRGSRTDMSVNEHDCWWWESKRPLMVYISGVAVKASLTLSSKLSLSLHLYLSCLLLFLRFASPSFSHTFASTLVSIVFESGFSCEPGFSLAFFQQSLFSLSWREGQGVG